MKYFPLLAIIVLASSYEETEFGTMHTTENEDHPTQSLIIAREKVFVSDWMTVFKYNFKDSTLLINARNFLKINDKGKLALAKTPHPGFFVGSRSSGGRLLYYNGVRFFFVCGDGLIETRGTCADAYRVSIIYEEFK